MNSKARVLTASVLTILATGCAHKSFKPDYPASWSPLTPSTNMCQSITGCYSPQMPIQELFQGEKESPYGEHNLTRAVLKHFSDKIDTNFIKPADSSSVCVDISDEKTVVFEFRSPDRTTKTLFDQHNSIIHCEGDHLRISRSLESQTFMYSYYLSYKKSLVMSNTMKGELVVLQEEEASGIPYSGERRVWSKYDKLSY